MRRTMPNWCENTISVSGNAELIKKLKDFVGRPIHKADEKIEEPIYSLANIMPSTPDSAPLLGKMSESTGFEDWYHNNINSWGTKWDVAGNVYMNDYKEGDEFIGYTFDSAWSPPSPTTERLSEIFPELTIEHKYYESGMDFWGIDTYKGGELISEIGGDLHHTAWITLGMECYQCEQYGEDPEENEEYLYSDCPPAIELAKKEGATE
jgi:hypothetical protein